MIDNITFNLTVDDEKEKENDLINEGIHGYTSEASWVKPEDPLILERIEWFQDQKLALMIHWGIYSQLGIIESWPLSDEDASWSRKQIEWIDDNVEFRRQYFEMNKSFNPIRFQPEVWADLAATNGFKYLIFTTKHHDGFCMWDTAQTDYKITAKDCPFHKHKYADIVKHTFNAFRQKGLGIAAYFSKPDWHKPYYWAAGMARGTNMWRHPTYNMKSYPWLWEKYVDFTQKQMMELVSNYGKIDVLWLDGGQVRPQNGQDIRLSEVAEKARKLQPWLLFADRTVGGSYENYITPEQEVPETPINVPWESCITMGTQFSFKFDDEYKSTRTLVHLLIDIVCKGGNLALNIGVQPDGRLPRVAVERMQEMGDWLSQYGEAIYETRVCAPYRIEHFAFTKKEDTVYAFLLYDSEDSEVKSTVVIPYKENIKSISLIGANGNLEFKQSIDGIEIKIPTESIQEKAPITQVFKMQIK